MTAAAFCAFALFTDVQTREGKSIIYPHPN
jgi:hypothetical protein